MSTDLIQMDAETTGRQLVAAVAAAREKIGSVAVRMTRDLVEVQAVLSLEAALTDEARAFVVAAGKQGYYELIAPGEIPDPLVIRVCVQALVLGLSLRGMQFGVYFSKGKASLFVKSAGYQQLFANSGRAGAVNARMGRAEIVKTGETKKDKACALAWVAGKASVMWDGQLQVIDARGEYAIGVDCEIGSTDGIDALQSRAKRRLLHMLWEQCSGSRESYPDAVAEGDSPEPRRAMAEQPTSGRNWDAEKSRYVAEYNALPDGEAKNIYLAVMRSDNRDEVTSLMSEAAKTKMDTRQREAIGRAAEWQRERIKAGAA